MQKIAWAYRNYAVALLMVVLPLQALSEDESRSCGRVDLRPKLEANGLRSVRHRGGRTDSASFAVSETLTLALASPLKPLPSGISARSLEHSFNHNDRSLMSELISVRSSAKQRAEFQNSLNSRFCSEEEAPSDDDESVRLARLRLLQQAYESLNLQALGLSGLSPVFDLLATKEFYEQNFSPLRCSMTLTPKRALRKIKSTKTAPAASVNISCGVMMDLPANREPRKFAKTAPLGFCETI
ncbi:MAG: hypothetical protein EOP05_23545 [Proteobacteria bacterium]|nr:MAG: hypothetical protein EOP05_23545 [Pseudomonadota bacterium]